MPDNLRFCSNQQSGIKSQLDSMQTVESQSATTTVHKLEDIRNSLATSLATALSTHQHIADLRGEIEGERDIISQQTTMLNRIRLNLDSLQDLMRVIPLEKRILKHVFYKSMFDREEAIRDAEEGTFAWLLEGQDDNLSGKDQDRSVTDIHLRGVQDEQREQRHLATGKLIAWLQHGSGVFHLSGKAGSGKSTAMKLIVNHERTRAELKSWAGDNYLVTSDHYFWAAGNEMGKSLEGLYRSILFDILRQCPKLISTVFRDQWAALESDAKGGPGGQGPIDIEDSLFRTSKMKDAFDRLMAEQLDNQYYICLFVDGLDEYQGDSLEHRRLAQSFLTWSQRPNVKCLLSSRPYPEFHKVFAEDTRLHLHRLNVQDIYTFSLHMFERDNNIEQIRLFYKRLVYDVTIDSEGVFLWAVLVVRMLLGSAGYDSEEILFQKLRSLPRELGKLYQALLESLEPLDRKRADRMLFLALTDTEQYVPLSFIAYSWVDMLDDPAFPFGYISPRSIDQALGKSEQQIASLTKGLLEVGPVRSLPWIPTEGITPSRGLLTKGIGFSHRTVADYLKCGGVLTCESTFNFAESFLRLRIAEIMALKDFKTTDSTDYEPLLLHHMRRILPDRPRNQYTEPYIVSHHVLKRIEAALPVSLLPPVYMVLRGGIDALETHREKFEGQTLSIPHFFVFAGLTDHVLSQKYSRPMTTSQVPDLHLLLSWVCMWDREEYASSDDTQRFLSHGFHFRDKVLLYPIIPENEDRHNTDIESGPHMTGTVWMVFVVRLWMDIQWVLRMDWQDRQDRQDRQDESVINHMLTNRNRDRLKHKLEVLSTFLNNGADPDVVISFIKAETLSSPEKTGQVHYTSLVDAIRALRHTLPTIIDFEGAPWDGILSDQGSISRARALPSWARKIPGATPRAQMEEVDTLFPKEYHSSDIYYCSREECIPAEFKVRIC